MDREETPTCWIELRHGWKWKVKLHVGPYHAPVKVEVGFGLRRFEFPNEDAARSAATNIATLTGWAYHGSGVGDDAQRRGDGMTVWVLVSRDSVGPKWIYRGIVRYEEAAAVKDWKNLDAELQSMFVVRKATLVVETGA